MIRVNATGCSLIDNLYSSVDFSTDAYNSFLSKSPGDGGLTTGGLVFSESLCNFSSKDYSIILSSLSEGKKPNSSNIGGPGIVPIIHANQVKRRNDIQYRFASVIGNDENGERFRSLMEKAKFPLTDYFQSDLPTPATDVLSDPSYNNGHGERTFIYTVGAAAQHDPKHLPEDFFDADIILFGGTALVPPLHDALDYLCCKAKESETFVIVTTVYDFRNHERNKGRPWPLVNDYTNIDLLCIDQEEALKISGQQTAQKAQNWFLDKGCGAVIVTQGPDNMLVKSNNETKFISDHKQSMPICHYADKVVASIDYPRDTTGCGDNFVGGLIDSLAHQMAENGSKRKLNLEEAVISGVAASSVALTCLGGVFYEKSPGEKRQQIDKFIEAYRSEIYA